MKMPDNLDQLKGWYEIDTANSDVVISTRIRFGRNIANNRFVDALEQEESTRILELLDKAFQNALPREQYTCGSVSSLVPIHRRLLAEKRLLPAQYILHQDYPLFYDRINSASGYVMDTDHLRFACIRPGRQVAETYQACIEIDNCLEPELDYAASIDWGYLSPDLSSSGLGVRGSFLLHLPGLVRNGMIDNALKAVMDYGFTVKGFQSDTGKSLADLYQVSNASAWGQSDEEFQKKLDTLGTQLEHYEHKSRQELFRKQKLEMEDSIFRSYGILLYCRSIGYLEALEHLSNVRLGCCSGLINIAPIHITRLFFVVEKSHVQAVCQTGTEEDINCVRADIIRSSLKDTLEGGA